MMSALSLWRRDVRERGLSNAEKNDDLRRHPEAFREFKAQRAEQQRKRRRRAKYNHETNHETHHHHQTGELVQLIQVNDGVEVFYVDLKYLQGKGHKIKNKVYAGKSAKKLMAAFAQSSKRKSKRNKHESDFDVFYKTLSRKKRAFGHESENEHNKVYATVVLT